MMLERIPMRPTRSLSYGAGDSPLTDAEADALTNRCEALLCEANIACHVGTARGLGHGAGVPLRLGWRNTRIPVCQASLPAGDLPRRTCADRCAPLDELPAKNVLAIASGGSACSLPAVGRGLPTPPEARDVEDWVAPVVSDGDSDALIGPASPRVRLRQAHPR